MRNIKNRNQKKMLLKMSRLSPKKVTNQVMMTISTFEYLCTNTKTTSTSNSGFLPYSGISISTTTFP